MKRGDTKIKPATNPTSFPPWVTRTSWLMKRCPNCTLYQWKELDGELLRCSGCKAVRYCSKECQREHWKKQHRDQCKLMKPVMDIEDPLLKQAYEKGDWMLVYNNFILRLLRENRENPEQLKKTLEFVHNPLDCSTCKQVAKLGPKINSITDPHLGCLLKDLEPFSSTIEIREVENSEKFTLIKLPYALGELTGVFTSKYEHTLSLMQRALHKMHLTSHPLVADDSRLQDLFFNVGSLRTQILQLTVLIPSGQILEYFHQDKIFDDSNHQYFNLTKLVIEITKELGFQDEMEWDTPYKLWKTFQVLFFYCLHPTHPDRVLFEQLGERVQDKSLNAALSQNETSEKFIMKRLAILGGLEKGLMPFTELLDILCEHDRLKICGACHTRIFIEDVIFPVSCMRGPSKPSMLILTGFSSSFCCSKLACYKTVAQNTQVLVMELQTIYHHFALKFTPNRCDMCLKFSKKVHRCDRCLTKVYCSEECRDRDWTKIHKELCKIEQDGRKVKGGVKVRSKVGEVYMEHYIKRGLGECEEIPFPQLEESLKRVVLGTTEKLRMQLV